jgi:hypothetical protein
MVSIFKPAVFIFIFISIVAFANFKPVPARIKSLATPPKIQVAILLDVSGSMDGLIEQAKTQLWNMVSILGKASCNNEKPELEIALYQYGESDDKDKNFIKQVNGFTNDLDSLSENLFSLHTDGSEEFCGEVIQKAVRELTWDSLASQYKVIFIAGNESFLQGDIKYTAACSEAKKKGIIVNTIYCGPKFEGIKENWNLGAECGNGSFTNIDQDAIQEDIPTPYDSMLMVMNMKLNNTYISYSAGKRSASQGKIDSMYYSMNRSAAVKRFEVKTNAALYRNSSWDVVDLYNVDTLPVQSTNNANHIMKYNIVRSSLPDSLKNKTPEELKNIVRVMNAERDEARKEISRLVRQREDFLTEERKNKNDDISTLETAVEKTIRGQVTRFNMVIR